MLISCQEDDVIVQSLFDLSGAPLHYDDSKATKFLNVATVSIHASREKDTNLAKIKAISREILSQHPETELLLFGETVLGWYIDENDPESYQRSIAESIPGPSTDAIAFLADSLNVHIVFGMTELQGDKLYNAQVFVNREGNIEAIHRKVNLTPEDKKNGITPALKIPENVTVVNINGIVTGMIICADVSSFWLTEQMIHQKVELILHSMAAVVPEFAIDPVSRQYKSWEVFSNRYGDELKWRYSGTIFIADPSGTIRTSGSGGEMYRVYKIGVR